jgi:predicted acetyltransferase
VARRNTGALAFWRQVAARAAREVDERDQDDENWDGTILRFRND